MVREGHREEGRIEERKQRKGVRGHRDTRPSVRTYIKKTISLVTPYNSSVTCK